MSVLIRDGHYQPKSSIGSQIRNVFERGSWWLETITAFKVAESIEHPHTERRIPEPEFFSLQETS